MHIGLRPIFHGTLNVEKFGLLDTSMSISKEISFKLATEEHLEKIILIQGCILGHDLYYMVKCYNLSDYMMYEHYSSKLSVWKNKSVWSDV